MNNVNLIARLTHKPELKQTPNGKYVCSFSVAVERKFKDAEGNATVDYIDCVVWNKNAEFLCKWFDKGVRVGITGELQTRTYTDKDGNNRKVTEVLVGSVDFADGKRDVDTSHHHHTNAVKTESDIDGFIPIDNAELPF